MDNIKYVAVSRVEDRFRLDLGNGNGSHWNCKANGRVATNGTGSRERIVEVFHTSMYSAQLAVNLNKVAGGHARWGTRAPTPFGWVVGPWSVVLVGMCVPKPRTT